jgi:hypothetical protein
MSNDPSQEDDGTSQISKHSSKPSLRSNVSTFKDSSDEGDSVERKSKFSPNRTGGSMMN